MGNALSPEDHERYRALIGSLVYVSAWSRPDIAFALSELSRFVASPGTTHLQAAKHLL